MDTIVFSGGIGEHAPEIRAEICQELEFRGVTLDSVRNAGGAGVISAEASRVIVRVIPTDEELMIARTVGEVLALAQSPAVNPSQ